MQTLDFLFLKVLDDIANNRPVSTLELEELRLVLRDMDEMRNTAVRSIRGVTTMSKIVAEETAFTISPARSICFSFTTLVNIPNNTYTAVDFTDTRGLINDQSPETYGCVKRVDGYTDRFTKQSFVADKYPIYFFGDFGFDANSTGSREIYIEFFNKSDVSLGGYTFAARAANTDWTNLSFSFMDWFIDGDYCKFWVWQDSGSALSITSANFGFMMG